MIHNPHVNDDLRGRGVGFVRTTSGEQLIPWDDLTPDDIVIVPAFGTSLEVQSELKKRGIDSRSYDTTCPFVEKVWNKSRQIGRQDFTVVIHGKLHHEETTATFSHAQVDAPVVVVRGLDEANALASVIKGERTTADFFERFADHYSEGFDPEKDLRRVGVVNQTTMLASETKTIAGLLREAMIARYGLENISEHFADTSDTLCYATNENQSATISLIEEGGDLALIVGGYNSSNTSHLVELCERAMPTFFVGGQDSIRSRDLIEHFDIHSGKIKMSENWYPGPDRHPVDIILTAGASCPDALLDQVIQKIAGWYPDARSVEEAVAPFKNTHEETHEA
jgi:4-hydroxy-3-methylbut-2-enyl diphosphate reductase